MANPFHDETGRFCSRGEMLGAVHKLASTGKVQEYLRLKSEFDEADKGNVTVSREVLDSLLQKSDVTGVEIPEDNEALDSISLYEKELEEYRNLSPREIEGFGVRENDVELFHRVLSEYPETSDDLIKGIARNFSITYEEKMDFVETYNPDALWHVAEHEGDYMYRTYPEHKELVNKRLATLGEKEHLSYEENRESHSLSHLAVKHVASSEELAELAKNTSYEGHVYDTVSVRMMQSPYLTSDIAKTVLEKELDVAEGDYRAARFYLEDRLKEAGHRPMKYNGPTIATPLEGAPSEKDHNLRQRYLEKVRREENPAVKEKLRAEAEVFLDTYASRYNIMQDTLAKAGSDKFSPELHALRERERLATTRLNNLEDYKHIKAILDTDPLKD